MGISSTQISEQRAKAKHRKWYGEHREEYNELRRARYANNKSSREKARDRASVYRSKDRIIDRFLTREVNGKSVEVFSTGQVAAILGRTPQMLRNWESVGLIPATIFNDVHRLYTKAQVRMLASLENIISNNKGSWSHPKVKNKIRLIAKKW